LYFSSGHVNLVLSKSKAEAARTYDTAQSVTIDFLPPPDAEMMPTEIISDRAIIAMYMNNRAAESLVQGKLDEAYWWARAAIDYDPAFLMGYNTLSTVYQRHGDIGLAERTLRFAHQHDPLNTVILFNLSEVTNAQGKTEEAARYKAELARLEPYPPFHFFHIGQQAMAERGQGRFYAGQPERSRQAHGAGTDQQHHARRQRHLRRQAGQSAPARIASPSSTGKNLNKRNHAAQTVPPRPFPCPGLYGRRPGGA
jgi:tetratricopeptide (TPR) repeat protein